MTQDKILTADQQQNEVQQGQQKDVLSLREAALYMDVAESTLYKKCFRREIPHYKFGKLTYFKRCELDEILTAKRVPCMAEVEQQAVSYCVCKTGRTAL